MAIREIRTRMTDVGQFASARRDCGRRFGEHDQDFAEMMSMIPRWLLSLLPSVQVDGGIFE